MTGSALVILFVAVFVVYSCEAQKHHCIGGRYDVFTKCGSNCEPSCSRPYTGPCIRSCAVNVCRCQPGYYRRESDQHCVLLDECISPQHPAHGGPPHGGPPHGIPPHVGPPYGGPPYGGPPYGGPPHGGPPHGIPPHVGPPYGRPPYLPPPYAPPPHLRPHPRPYDFARSN